MLRFLIQYAANTYCINYSYLKLSTSQNKKVSFNIVHLLITLLTTAIFYVLPSEFRFIVPPLQVLLLFIYFYTTGSETAKTTFTTTILSYAICYICFFTAALLIIIPLTPIVAYFIDITSLPTNFLQFIVSFLQCTFCHLLFHTKRFQNGIPLIHNPFVTRNGVFLGALFMCCHMFFSANNYKVHAESDFFLILAILFSLILLALFFFWWQGEIHHCYLLQSKAFECDSLEKQLTYYQEELGALEKDNEKLSKLIHRDNKLIPSMQLAVHSFLNCSLKGNTENLSRQGEALLHQLEAEMSERSSIVTTLFHSQKQLPHTNILSIDQLLSYFLQRCDKDGIAFDCSFWDNVSLIPQKALSEKDLLTLLADLLENALIATRHNQGNYILLHMGISDDCSFIEVLDSGHLFPKEVLYYWGQKRYTTHKEHGGSGIGMMVIYELLQKYHASFVIDETISNENFYTKKVTVIFDGKSRYHLYSNRSSEELAYLARRSDLKIFSDAPK